MGRDGDLIGDEGVSSGVFDEVMVKIMDDGEVGAVYFLGGYPEYILIIGFGLGDIFFKFGVGGGLNRRVVFELSEEIRSFLHDNA